MRTTKYHLLFLIILFFFSLNCTHVNELYKYDFSSRLCYFKYYANPKISSADFQLSDYSYSNNFLFGIILESIGESYLENGVREKLKKAIQPDSITLTISEGIKEGLMTYYDIVPVDSISDEPDFIVETQLNGFSLSSNTYGIYANIDSRVSIISRQNAGTAWESDVCSSYPVRDIVTGYSTNPWIRTTGGVINAVRLMQMTEEEIKECINVTVQDVSKEQTERLRQDIYEASQVNK